MTGPSLYLLSRRQPVRSSSKSQGVLPQVASGSMHECLPMTSELTLIARCHGSRSGQWRAVCR